MTKAAKEALAKIPDRELAVIDVRTKRSEAQNALYWAILSKIAPHLPGIENKDKLHLALKLALGKYDLMEVRGKAVPVPQSTSRMSVKKFAAYFNDAIDMLIRDLLPKIGDDDLTAEVIEMIGHREAA